MYRNRSELEQAYRAKKRHTMLFFWGHQPAKDGRLTTSCFSQWWPAPFHVDGVRYPTAEHWMMAAKARLFGDEEAASRIVSAGSPKEAKAIGREAKGFDTATWDRQKFDIVKQGNMYKFGAHADLRKFLLGTGDKILVEASPVDRVWGIGLAADDEAAGNPLRWRGENLLGFALMEVRHRLTGSVGQQG